MLSPKNQEDGFTLIELLVVIIIIGILAAIAIPLFLDQRKLAVDASVKADVRNTVANVQTWQASDETKRTKAEANTAAYVADGGKIAQTPGNSVGVSIDSTGAATICAYNAGGKTYLGESAAYTFDPTTGQFNTGSCVASSTTGGLSPAAQASAVFSATSEDGDATNTAWSDTASRVGYAARTGSYGRLVSKPSQGQTQTLTLTVPTTAGASYKFTGWVQNNNYLSGTGTRFGRATVVANNNSASTSSTQTNYVQLTFNFTGKAGATSTPIQFAIDSENSSAAMSMYVDDVTVAPN